MLDPIDEGVVWNYRLTRALVAAACGAGLATCGVILQSLLRNPLADPYLLGISAGASTGAVLVALIGVGGGLVSLSAGAFVGAMAAFALVTLLARASGSSTGTGQIILAGIAGSQLFNALTAFLITKSASSEQARGILFWLLGNLSGVRWPSVWLVCRWRSQAWRCACGTAARWMRLPLARTPPRPWASRCGVCSLYWWAAPRWSRR
ncbi:iron chelate uptake ABC transporter permease [Pseudomonas fluorescens]|uniref:Iron chelate uptake ABC transporter permease n=1 Tax=Pseudomonas fluorescens TaxID=294 RepID=A0A8B4I9L0_PSEFL|nr:iron chelate uptake ABC transporter permease [Pseudomonas fluorescens]